MRQALQILMNYMSTLWHEHAKKGYFWDQALCLEAIDSTRDGRRGISPAKQAAAFPGGREAVVAVKVLNTGPLVAGSPVGMISLRSWWSSFLCGE